MMVLIIMMMMKQKYFFSQNLLFPFLLITAARWRDGSTGIHAAVWKFFLIRRLKNWKIKKLNYQFLSKKREKNSEKKSGKIRKKSWNFVYIPTFPSIWRLLKWKILKNKAKKFAKLCFHTIKTIFFS